VAPRGSSCRWPELATASGGQAGLAVTLPRACRRFVSYRNRALNQGTPLPAGARTQVLAAHMPLPRRFKELAREILCWSSTRPHEPRTLALSYHHHWSLDWSWSLLPLSLDRPLRLFQLGNHAGASSPRPGVLNTVSRAASFWADHTRQRHAWPLPSHLF
jgi:hypothetical protein